jgi:hypothetical protein
MNNQGLSEGSLRHSHRETHAVRRKPAPAALQELARKLVERSSSDLVLRQRLDLDRLETPLKRGTFYVMENEGRADPGFLVFLPGKPAVYCQFRRGRDGSYFVANTLRLRASTSLGEGGGTILIATLDDVLHTLRLEDVWMWRGEAVAETQPFSRRREKLKEFVERHWIPDARLLGGIFTSVANPISFEAFSTKSMEGVNSIDIIPEAAGRRRMYMWLEERANVQVGPAGVKQDRKPTMAPPAASTPQTIIVESKPSSAAPAKPPQVSRRARAVPVEKMPDIYDLYGEDGIPISRASVQMFSLSQQLRVACQAQKEAWVTATWRSEFGGYEITALV